MHESDTAASSAVQATLNEEAFAAVPPAARKREHAASPSTPNAKPVTLWARLRGFLRRLFAGSRSPQQAHPIHIPELTAADRAAAARAAQMPPPVAFKGDTASTLVTPMGAYAGKPVDLAIRKRAEQQFRTMDVTQSTMN
jgi:hypothetical protein